MKTSVHHKIPLMSKDARHGMGEGISNTFTQLTFIPEFYIQTQKSTIKRHTNQFLKWARI